jgi:hypothetical protein
MPRQHMHAADSGSRDKRGWHDEPQRAPRVLIRKHLPDKITHLIRAEMTVRAVSKQPAVRDPRRMPGGARLDRPDQ